MWVRTHLSVYTLLSFPTKRGEINTNIGQVLGSANIFYKVSENKYFRHR